ncbi:MAG: binding-protein-dependent transport system inner rane component [Chloroflexi bacterium]|nr:binding-protein-dependent transport system inner rane component [Chloroflexota bacterium]
MSAPATMPAAQDSRPVRFGLLTRALGRNRAIVAGLAIVLALTLVALAASMITPYSYHAMSYDAVLAGPSRAHVFGTDGLGRDLFTRVVYSFQVSLKVAFGSVVLALLVGIPLGLVAGYWGGLLDGLLMRLIDMLLAFPAILLAIALITILGQGLTVMVIAIAVVYVPILARVLRGSVLDVRQATYVEGARARGAGHMRLMLRHVLPNSIGPTLVQATLLMAFAIQIEAGLSFLGLGVQPPTPSLGYMLQENHGYISQSPWGSLFPCLAIALAVLGFNLLGTGLRSSLDPRGRAR